jgi:DNA-binding response OmpR family regulator
MRILVAEDDPYLSKSIKKGLENLQYAIDCVDNGQEVVSIADLVDYDLIILDVLLPALDGFEVCKQLRRRQLQTPILFLTALGGVDERVKGLDLGADDYLTKPFAFRELEARIRALLRRESPSKTNELSFLDITLNVQTHQVQRGPVELILTAKEFALLEVFMRYPRQVLSRTMIAEHLWNIDAENLSNVIDVYIGYLRRKICERGEPNVIHTVRGFGYQLKEP